RSIVAPFFPLTDGPASRASSEAAMLARGSDITYTPVIPLEEGPYATRTPVRAQSPKWEVRERLVDRGRPAEVAPAQDDPLDGERLRRGFGRRERRREGEGRDAPGDRETRPERARRGSERAREGGIQPERRRRQSHMQ